MEVGVSEGGQQGAGSELEARQQAVLFGESFAHEGYPPFVLYEIARAVYARAGRAILRLVALRAAYNGAFVDAHRPSPDYGTLG